MIHDQPKHVPCWRRFGVNLIGDEGKTELRGEVAQREGAADAEVADTSPGHRPLLGLLMRREAGWGGNRNDIKRAEACFDFWWRV